MTNRIWGIGAVVLIGAILVLGWLLGVTPLLAQARAADDQRTTVEQNNLLQAVTLEQMKADYERIDELKAEVDGLRLSIPGEFDSDVIYAYLSAIQSGTGAPVESIETGEAQTYGLPAGETATAPPTTTTTEGTTTEATPPDPATPDPAAAPLTIPGVENLYTVPVTITFKAGTPAANILAFAGELQNGPRVFLVTSIAREAGSESAGKITAYTFVISDPDDTPGSAAGEYGNPLWTYVPATIKPWGLKAGDPNATPTPDPTETSTPAPSGSPTPSPTP